MKKNGADWMMMRMLRLFVLFVGASETCKICKVERMSVDSCMQVGKRLTLTLGFICATSISSLHFAVLCCYCVKSSKYHPNSPVIHDS